LEVRVSISNPEVRLKANMSANAKSFSRKEKRADGSRAALIYDKERKRPSIIPDAKAENGKKKLSVKLGISNGVKTEFLTASKKSKKSSP